MNEFAKVLHELTNQSGKSRTKIAQDGNFDIAYGRKLEFGEKRHPSPITVVKIATGLVADPTLFERNPEFLQNAFEKLMAAMIRDGLAGDHLN